MAEWSFLFTGSPFSRKKYIIVSLCRIRYYCEDTLAVFCGTKNHALMIYILNPYEIHCPHKNKSNAALAEPETADNIHVWTFLWEIKLELQM